jgi:type IV pilus assembly protein PilY1
MFRTDENGSPLWQGNVKQYQFKYDAATGSVRLGDADGLDAIDATTGFVSVLARSYWTTPSTFWANWVPGRTATASDSRDGPEVQKGGAAQRQRETNLTAQTGRSVYTCPVNATTGAPTCVANALLSTTPFSAASLNPANAGTLLAFNYPAAWPAATSATTDIGNLIAWTRGTDNLANESGPGSLTTIRPSVHGDVVHSRPVVINYGGSPPRVVVFYGSNNGMLRAIEGKQTGTGAGNELWSFVVPETLGKLNRLREQTPKVAVPVESRGPDEQQGLLHGRCDRRLSGRHDGDHLCIGATRRQFHLRDRRERSRRTPVQVQAVPQHDGHERSRARPGRSPR